jgi:DNA adenine methylase
MFVYLNRTGYNGLFRLNGTGSFNVPMGRYENPRVCDPDNLRLMASALRESQADIRNEHFAAVRSFAKTGDFIYFAPPYAPLTDTATFTSYTAGGFGDSRTVTSSATPKHPSDPTNAPSRS